MNILVLTDVLPAPLLPHKQQENDVLLITAALHEAAKADVHYSFVYVATYSNALLALLSPKFTTFRQFIKLGTYQQAGRTITIAGIPNIGAQGLFKRWLIPLGFQLNKRRLQKLIREQKIDLIHAHNIKSDAGLAFEVHRHWKIPYIVTSRKLGKYLVDGPMASYLKKAKAIFNLGKIQQELARDYNANSFLVPHGIDERFLQQRKVYAVPEATPLRIVSLCRLLSWKNLDQVIRALELVEGDFLYEIYGDGPEMNKLQQQVAASRISDKVRLRGKIPYEEVPAMLVTQDLFVLPSYLEMFGRVYIEAMACGLPVIGARHCGIDGYIKEGKEGFLVNHRNIEEIRYYIQKFITLPELKMCMGIEAKFLSGAFSWTKVIAAIDTYYRKAIA